MRRTSPRRSDRSLIEDALPGLVTSSLRFAPSPVSISPTASCTSSVSISLDDH